jgi:hypothetical protein
MKTALCIVCVLLSSTLFPAAQLVASFSGGDDLSVGPGTAGYSFTVGAAPLTIRTLGVWESSGGFGLFSSHEVGIWDVSPQHNLLASVVIPATGATKIDEFWYMNLPTPLTLTAGSTYLIAAHYLDNDFDLARGNATSVTVTSGVTVGDAYLSSGTGFEYPDLDVAGANKGFFGANAGFAPVPEPAAACAIVGIALAAFALARKRMVIMAASAAILMLSAQAADPAVSVKAVLDATPASRKELLAKLQKQNPARYKLLSALIESEPAENRPPITPGNTNGNRPLVPPGLANYGKP